MEYWEARTFHEWICCTGGILWQFHAWIYWAPESEASFRNCLSEQSAYLRHFIHLWPDRVIRTPESNCLDEWPNNSKWYIWYTCVYLYIYILCCQWCFSSAVAVQCLCSPETKRSRSYRNNSVRVYRCPKDSSAFFFCLCAQERLRRVRGQGRRRNCVGWPPNHL